MYGANVGRMSNSVKRLSNRARRRQAEAAIAEGSRAVMVLLAVLAQKGGEAIVTDGTIAEVGRNLAHLDYTVEEKLKGEWTVRLVEGGRKGVDAVDTEAGRVDGAGLSGGHSPDGHPETGAAGSGSEVGPEVATDEDRTVADVADDTGERSGAATDGGPGAGDSGAGGEGVGHVDA